MRQDQYERLQQIEEKLADVFIAEADPAAWPLPGTPSANLSAEDRKQRYQFKRAAAETAQLLVRTQNLIAAIQGGGLVPPWMEKPPETPEQPSAEEVAISALEREVVDSEHQAARLRAELIAKAQRSASRDAAG